MTRLGDVAVRAYPPSFRARYGPELAALVEDLPSSPRTTADLLMGAVRVWVRPPLPTRQRRLQATTATTWVAWCAGFLAAPAVNRALSDPPSAGASGVVRALLSVAYVLFFAGWALALLGAVPVVLAALVPAVRARRWRVVRPLIPALTLGLVEAAGLLAFALSSHPRSGPGPALSGPVIAAIALWLIGFAVFVASLGIGPALTLTRLEPGGRVLRLPTRLTVPIALILTALTG